MAHTSKKSLSDKEQALLIKQFVTVLANKQAGQVEKVLMDVLTPAEQIVLIKRVAAIIMLDTGLSTYEVARTVKLSTATTAGYRQAIQAGQWSALLQHVRGTTFDQAKFWKTVEKILRVGMPPISGPGRWGTLASVRGTRAKKRI